MPVTIQTDNPCGDRAQILQQSLLGEQDRGPRIRQHVGPAIGGRHWIQWYIGPARLEDPQQRHQHRGRPLQKNSHQRARTHTHPDQIVRELVGRFVERPIAQLLAFKHHRHRVRRARRLSLEQLVNAGVSRYRNSAPCNKRK